MTARVYCQLLYKQGCLAVLPFAVSPRLVCSLCKYFRSSLVSLRDDGLKRIIIRPWNSRIRDVLSVQKEQKQVYPLQILTGL